MLTENILSLYDHPKKVRVNFLYVHKSLWKTHICINNTDSGVSHAVKKFKCRSVKVY